MGPSYGIFLSQPANFRMSYAFKLLEKYQDYSIDGSFFDEMKSYGTEQPTKRR